MKIWKQAVGAAVILAGATTAWAFFHPSAPGILQKLGIDWAPAATADVATDAAPQDGNRSRQSASGPLVIVQPVSTATINDRLSAIGTGRAKSTVAVTTFAAGRMDELLVESGSIVNAASTAGSVQLMRTSPAPGAGAGGLQHGICELPGPPVTGS